MWAKPGHVKPAGSLHTVAKAINIKNTVDRYGFFEQQLDGGTYIDFNQSISRQQVKFICTNFNGNPTHGSYIKVNGTLIAGDKQGLAPDGVNTNLAPFQMGRGHTIVVINPADGSIRAGYPKLYDTYGNSALCSQMRLDLNIVDPNDIVAIGTYDATSCTQDLRDGLTNYFGDITYSNTWTSSRISQMFLGKRNSFIDYLPGAVRRTYGSYYNGTKAYFNTASVTATTVATDFQVSTNTANFSYQYQGYILADYTGTWTFAFTTDDYCHIWIGPEALRSPDVAGAENAASPIGSGSFTVNMVSGTYYPIKVMYGNSGGPGNLTLSWNRNGSGASTNWTNKLYFNPRTNGF
jgi:hypothetical protein